MPLAAKEMELKVDVDGRLSAESKCFCLYSVVRLLYEFWR